MANRVSSAEDGQNMTPVLDRRIQVLLLSSIVGMISIVIVLALTAATLGIVVSRLKSTDTTLQKSLGSVFAESIHVSGAMAHLNELQTIATGATGTRAVNTAGFNRTLDYITNQLSIHTNFKVAKQYFYLRNFLITTSPILITSINGIETTRIFSTNLSTAEFFYVQYTRSVSFSNFIKISVIPDVGCTDADWLAATPSPAGQVALVKRGVCTFADKAALALKYNVAALLFYNDGVSSDRFSPISISLGQANELPALFLSYNLAQELANAALNPSNNVGVRITITVADESTYPIGNICADTPTGDVTQTIVVGSHSDSVPAGPGINDNGSGSAANLELALTLARLFETSTYAKYKYRVRFCWWGAEELGLLGSNFHVREAKASTIVGERLTDYLVNLNYDMLGSPNFILGLYDGKTANANTPPSARPGSNKLTDLYREWFIKQNLPWNYTEFSGRSDYGPFLAEGIAAGGLFSGADGIKSINERNYYDLMLGQGLGGIAGAIHDPCYHRACDSIQNINVFAYEKMLQAAAYILEFLGQQDDLNSWLYPSVNIDQSHNANRQKFQYDSINEYFGLPYL